MMRTPRIFLRATALLLTFAMIISAAAPPGNERILQQQLKQQQIQKTTQRVADQLSSVITEFDRNGIAGEDVKVLRAIRTVLGRLTEREMAQVIALLQQADKSGDDAASKKNVTEAYSNQKTIITQLKQLLLEYQRQQALYEISLMLRGLAARQSSNMRLGVWLARSTDQKGGANGFSEDEKRYLQQQGIDQAALKDETVMVLKKIESLAKETDGSATGERPKAALDQARTGGLVAALDAALDDLKNSKLLSATGNEKKARDQMRDVARALLMSKDLADLLRAAIQETENTIIQQKQVIDFTRKMERREEARDAEDKQFEVVDNTDLIRRDINDVVPTAASYFRDAVATMQEAREVLSASKDIKNKLKEAPPKEMDGLTNLELAKRELQEALAKAEKDATKPESVLANLRELKKQVEELIQREEKLKEETAAAEQKPQELKAQAPKQGEIRDDTQSAQQKASSDAPEAAQALNEAANQMEKAQKDLAQSKNSPEAEQAAVDALKRANEELDKQIAKMEEAEKQLASLEELREKVNKVIKDEQKIRLDTAKEAVKDKPNSLSQVAVKQQETGVETANIQKEAAEPAPTAAQHLDQAKNQMNEAKAQLDKAQAKAAQEPEAKALKELFAAKKDIESKISELRDELGLPKNDMAQNLADAAAALEKAQKEVNEAQAQMADAGLMDALLKKQQEIAAALAEQAKAAPSQKVSEAQKSAERAAQQLGESNLKSAVGEMAKAEGAIEAANSIAPQQPKQPGDATKPLPEIGQDQREVKLMTEQLLAAQENANEQAMQAAANLLEQALNDVSPIATGEMGPLPAAANQAVQSAQASLTEAAAQAGAQKAQPAQANAAAAAQALAQAQAALALAQAGLNSEMAGKGQQPGQGQGKQGQGQSKGDGQQPGKGKGTPAPRGDGKDGNWAGAGGADGNRSGTAGSSSSFVGLPQRDRAAIQQSQAEKYPQEYGPLVEQYLKNLSDQSGK
ncbi:MAG TPA: hypothetical protein VK530_05695 [Candidatus Acidoferrum sp.]|nr:hypothetical protein [Candidatus Acidoferrum sp.]